MRSILTGMIMIAIVCVSCRKDEAPRFSGEVVLSSELLQSGQTYAYYGFMYATGEVNTYLQTNTPPDLYADENEFGDSIVVLLGSSNFEDAFYLNGTFETARAARDFYEGYLEVSRPDADFVPLATNIMPHQVWTQKTVGDKYAKLLIKEVLIKTGITTDWFAEIRFRYTYQPDGSKIFPP